MRRVAMSVIVGAVLLSSGCGAPAAPSGAGGTDSGSKPVVGVILPDTTSSARWETQDRPRLEQNMRFAGIEPVVQNADGDEKKFAAIADDLIGRHVKALMITPLSSDGGAAVERRAKAAGIPVIDYDRLTLGGTADYYVSFDNTAVGVLQGQGLLKCLGNRTSADVIQIEGAPTDNNATLFAQGQDQVLGPKYAAGFHLVKSQAVDGWKPDLGGQLFEQILTANGGRVDGVVAANDGLAEAVIDVLRNHNLAGKVPVTGQDATVTALREILRGNQCMTVYKPATDEAEAAARLAIALAKGEQSNADDLATGNTRDLTGGRNVKSVLLGPQAITKESVKKLVTDGAVKTADLCAGDVAPLCAANDVVG